MLRKSSCLFPVYIYALPVCICLQVSLEGMLLIYTTQYEGGGRKYRLPGHTGKCKFLYYISGLGIQRLKCPKSRFTFLIPSFCCTHTYTLSTEILLLLIICSVHALLKKTWRPQSSSIYHLCAALLNLTVIYVRVFFSCC